MDGFELSAALAAVSILCIYCGKRVDIDDSTSTVGLYMNTAFEDELGDEFALWDQFFSQQGETVEVSDTVTHSESDWSWTFWFGETLAMTTIGLGSHLESDLGIISDSSLAFDHENEFKILYTIISSLLPLWLRGRIWGYATLAGILGVIAVSLVEFNAFCLVEMIVENVSRCIVSEVALEKIVRHRLKKVGEKIRLHDKKIKWMIKRKRIRRRLRRVLGKVLKNEKAP